MREDSGKDKLIIRNADISDALFLYTLASEATVRNNSFNKEPFTFGHHVKWLRARLSDPGCHIFVACLYQDGGYVPVGQMRLDVDDKGDADIDYSIVPDYRGRGYGRRLLEAAGIINDARIRTLTGRVISGNTASQRAFEACGFEKSFEPGREYILYTKAVDPDEGAGKRKRILICTLKSWNIRNAQLFANRYAGIYDVYIITGQEELNTENLEAIGPHYIFFPHWSTYIKKEITDNYRCIIFHMTDLPYGRGGSPLQNLIVRGHRDTVISAIRADEGMDTGAVYMKVPLSLEGSADEIFKRASDIIFNVMIPGITEEGAEPVPQQGEPVIFSRRKPKDSIIEPGMDMEKIYDYIRMLDGEGYPPAYAAFGEDMVMEFSGASYDGEIVSAHVVFRKRSGSSEER